MMMTPDPQIARLEYTIREQMTLIEQMQAEIDRLVGWIMGDQDALTTLQNVYLDPKESPGNRIKAAASALPFERPRMTPTNLVVIDFRERVRQARLKAPLVEPKLPKRIAEQSAISPLNLMARQWQCGDSEMGAASG